MHPYGRTAEKTVYGPPAPPSQKLGGTKQKKVQAIVVVFFSFSPLVVGLNNVPKGALRSLDRGGHGCFCVISSWMCVKTRNGLVKWENTMHG